MDSSIIEHYIVQIMNKSVKLSYGRHYIDQTDLKEIKNALFSGYLSSGSYINKFENLIKKIKS